METEKFFKTKGIGNQAHDALGQRGFSRPCLAYQTQGLTIVQLQVNVVKGVHGPVLCVVLYL